MYPSVQAAESMQTGPVRPPPLRKASLQQSGGDDQRFAAFMRAAQNGDRAAYASLLQDLVPLLQRLIRRRITRAMDRDDLVQDILLSVHAARGTYDPSRPFMPWLLSIVHNRMVDRVRRHAKVWENEVLVDEFAESISSRASEDGASEDDEYGDPEMLHRAVSRLPARQRIAIELVKLRELSLKEAADLTGVSMGALKVSVHRAIRSLRGALA